MEAVSAQGRWTSTLSLRIRLQEAYGAGMVVHKFRVLKEQNLNSYLAFYRNYDASQYKENAVYYHRRSQEKIREFREGKSFLEKLVFSAASIFGD